MNKKNSKIEYYANDEEALQVCYVNIFSIININFLKRYYFTLSSRVKSGMKTGIAKKIPEMFDRVNEMNKCLCQVFLCRLANYRGIFHPHRTCCINSTVEVFKNNQILIL